MGPSYSRGLGKEGAAGDCVHVPFAGHVKSGKRRWTGDSKKQSCVKDDYMVGRGEI